MQICPKLLNYDKPILIEKIAPRLMRIVEETEVFDVIIPKGYETNGASVPRLFWNLLSPFTEGFRAALVHDYRYTDPTYLSREEADLEFFHNLSKDNVNLIRRVLVYLAVKFFNRNRFVGPPSE